MCSLSGYLEYVLLLTCCADMMAASRGLTDDQFVKLKKDLWEAAGGGFGRPGPQDDAQRKPKLEKTDPSTWTWANLTTQIPPDNVAVLADMQRYAGKHYIRQVNQPLNLLSMNSECINILPLKSYLNAKDKHELTHAAGRCVSFNLDVSVFTKGNRRNSGNTLTELKRLLCPNETHFVELLASPITSVTLPHAARVRAGIPGDAMFYCFCYPLMSTLPIAGVEYNVSGSAANFKNVGNSPV